jgi:Phage terminase large subunit (GpA)
MHGTRAVAALRRHLTEFAAEAGYRRTGSIPETMSFRAWCETLAAAGLKVDGFAFTLADRPSMHFIYDLIPTTIAEAYGRTVVMMKCAQVGFTVMEMLAAIYLALKFEPCKVGLYLPDMNLASAKSSERFMPIMRTVPDAYSRLTREDGTGRKAGEGNVMIRAMGDSRFHFLWTSGRATTESFPMDSLSFDEVQEMSIADMEKTRERLSASRIKFTLMGSTANWPDRDIHYWYQRGTMHQFHTRCPGCQALGVLDESFPECIGFDEVREDYRYRCKACGGWIDDPQDGTWIARNPDAAIVSAHYPQLLSPTITPREIIESYFAADDMKNFYNRKLGKPYTDPSQVPVDLAVLNACAAEGIKAGLEWRTRGRHTFMGIDQMGAFNVAIIKERMADGRQAVVHLEYIYDPDPFARCSELMDLFGVQICVVETLPNYNDAKRFSQRHRSRVYLAAYADISDEMLRWGDTGNSKADRRISDAERDRYTVTLDQYKCMQVSMARFSKKLCLFPDPQGLTQEVLEKGVRKRVAPLKDIAFLHFTRTALVAEKDPEQKKYRRRVVKIGVDPHTSYANMLCDVAWARAHGTGTMLLPSEATPARPMAQRVAAAMPGLPNFVLAMMEDVPFGTCGRCGAFNAGRCEARDLNVLPGDAACPLYETRLE